MKIGIVTTWFERGAGYVSKLYRQALEKENDVYIYARGGLRSDKPEWNDSKVCYGLRLPYTYINKKHFFKWIRNNDLDVIFFNEQHELSIVAETKKSFPNLKLGSYIDYYKEDDVELFNIYDFVICNTLRHLQAMKNHKQSYYIKWGTDLSLYKPCEKETDELVFFHSMGMSFRKGTKRLIKTFIKGKFGRESKLIIHTQLPLNQITEYSEDELEKFGIIIISKTVTAPGLYHLGDVYVYPTELDGLGLTMYEALACGLPVITTNNAPMNEVIEDNVNGKLVSVEEFRSRADGYYWPLSICNEDSLLKCIQFYVDNKNAIEQFKCEAREYAEKCLDFASRYNEINTVFKNSKTYEFDIDIYKRILKKEKKARKMSMLNAFSGSSRAMSLIWKLVK